MRHHSAGTSVRNPEDYLSFRQIEEQYPDNIKAETLYVWACTHRYDFHRIVTKIGSNSRVRRDRWEKFLDTRTLGISDVDPLKQTRTER